ncbi:MAG: FHA domain-containing protein [Hyphomonas sp.]
MAVEECGGLLDDHGLCTVCVAPYMQIDAGALTAAKVGGAVALPISVANLSAVGRPLFVTGLWSREASGTWKAEEIGWERLAAGETRPISIVADEIEKAGAHSLQIMIGLSSRWRWRQENFAFVAQVTLMVEDPSAEKGPVVNIGGQSAGHGNTVYISGKGETKPGRETTIEASRLTLVRAEREERRLGLRGIDAGSWVPRHAEFTWQGFAKGDAPHNGPILAPDGVLAAGRSRTRLQDGEGDVRLLVDNPSGGIDEAISRTISRRHFELYIESDRLMLRVNGSRGIRVNGNALGEGKVVQLSDGDAVAPLVSADQRLTLKFSLQSEHGSVRRIVVQRVAS